MQYAYARLREFSNESVFICWVVNYRLKDTASRSYNSFNISVDIMFVGKHTYLAACWKKKGFDLTVATADFQLS